MANIKISELNELTSSQVDNNDVLPIVDVSTDETKKITVENIREGLAINVKNTYSTSQNDTYSCDYSNKAFGGTLLWTNPNPTSTFSAQNIQLSSSDYDIYECIYVISSGVNDRYLSSKSVKGKGFILEFYDGYEKKGGIRSISYTDATHLSVQQSYYDGTGSATYCIPEYIIGYKTGLF